MRRFPIILVIVAAFVSGAATASNPDLKSMTLRLSDLPAGFTAASSHAKSKAQLIKDQGYAMPGYVSGWESVFKRSEGFRTAEVDSNVAWYGSAAQAHASMLDTYQKAAKQGKKATRVSVGAPLGDEARAYKIPGTSGVVVYMVVWRYKNVKAGILFGGLPSIGTTAEGATRLADKQQKRITAAL